MTEEQDRTYGFRVGDGIGVLRMNLHCDGTECRPTGDALFITGRVTEVKIELGQTNVFFVTRDGVSDVINLLDGLTTVTVNPYLIDTSAVFPINSREGYAHPVLAVTRTPREILK